MNVFRMTSLALVAAIALASFFLVSRDEDPETPGQSALREGYYLTGVTLRGTNASGAIEYELRADRADHDPADDSITLNQLALEYGSGDDEPWTVRAARGFMPDVETSIALSGGVEITRSAVEAETVTAINTDTMLIELDSQRASTQDDVVVAMGRNQLAGTGLHLDFQNEQVEILSNVHGRFEARETP